MQASLRPNAAGAFERTWVALIDLFVAAESSPPPSLPLQVGGGAKATLAAFDVAFAFAFAFALDLGAP
ncbi:hypothetical protein, partial [Dyella tabacisoli]|uniref:hypothetical protein n=1 Tax=Dyella tabacisoli TaxID=2282381 RepID=UPI00361D5F32